MPDEVGHAVANATVRGARTTDELTVDYDDLERQLSDRTRVVALAIASNETGSMPTAKRICDVAREAGAISWFDAVDYAAHEPIDVRELGCDVLLCSPYKSCGLLAGRNVRPGRFRTSCSPSATVAYRDSIGGLCAIRDQDRALRAHFLSSLPANVTRYGPPTATSLALPLPQRRPHRGIPRRPFPRARLTGSGPSAHAQVSCPPR